MKSEYAERDAWNDSETPKVLPSSASRGPRVLQYLMLTAFALIFLFSARLLVLRWLGQSLGKIALAPVPARESDLPSQFGAWQVTKFEHKVRNDAFGPGSSMWTVRQGTKQAIVSVDGPYSEYHPLNICYAHIGWSTTATWNYDPSGGWDSPQLNATVIQMSKPDSNGLVIFSAVDRLGRLVAGTGTVAGIRHGRDIVGNIKSVLGMKSISNSEYRGLQLPVYQLQVLYQTEADITPSDALEIEALFRAARTSFLSMERFRSADTVFARH